MMTKKKRTHIGFDAILNVWYPGHDIIQGGDICDDGLLIWMGNIHICKERERRMLLESELREIKLKSLRNECRSDAHPRGPAVW